MSIELNNAHLRCRTYGHSWDEFRPMSASRPADLTLRCDRCHTERYDVIDRTTGDVERRSYVYPSGYRTARLQRTDLRLELLRRLKKTGRAQ